MYTIRDICENTGFDTNKIYPLVNKSGIPVVYTKRYMPAGRYKRPTKVRCFTKDEVEKILQSSLEYQNIHRNIKVIALYNSGVPINLIIPELNSTYRIVKRVIVEYQATGLVTIESKLNYTLL